MALQEKVIQTHIATQIIRIIEKVIRMEVQLNQIHQLMMKTSDTEKAQMKIILILKKHNNQKLNKKWKRRN
jgi:hypothetical protein